MEIKGKIIYRKFHGICDHSPVGFNRKQVLAILFLNINRSIGIFGKSDLNRMVSNDNSIWTIGGYWDSGIIGFRNGTKGSKVVSNINWWSMFMFDQLFISVCSRLFIFWSLACHYSTACRSSWVRKSGIDFLEPLIYSMSKSKTLKIACHLAKICFEAMVSTFFL